MNVPLILEEENKRKGWNSAEAAEQAKIDIEKYLKILTGEIKPDYEEAVKLSLLYNIPASLFISEDESPIYINNGSGNYNNSISCYIGSYNVDSGLKDLVKELITIIKPDIIWPKESKREPEASE